MQNKKKKPGDLTHTPTDPDFISTAVDKMLGPFDGLHEIHHYVKPSSNRNLLVKMQSNDYLSIASDQRIAKAKSDYLLSHGHGDAVSRIYAHDRDDIHRAFERRMADMTGAEDAVLVMSGYNANTGLIQSFARPDTPVYVDQRAHASLWEGILCARAKARPFRHNDTTDLEKKVRRYGPGLILVDALYSTTGTISPLEEMVGIAEMGDCAIVVDETHSFGCHGKNGAGLVASMGLSERVHFRTVGLSKAMAARGGVVLGSARNMEYLRYEARPMIYSTAVLGYEVAGFHKTLDMLADEPWRQQALHRNHRLLKAGLQSAGYNLSASDSQIIGIVVGENSQAEVLKNYLETYGIAGSGFGPPATQKGKSLIRFTVNAGLTEMAIDHTIVVCRRALDSLDTAGWVCLDR